jgi:hypothetical protein
LLLLEPPFEEVLEAPFLAAPFAPVLEAPFVVPPLEELFDADFVAPFALPFDDALEAPLVDVLPAAFFAVAMFLKFNG